MFYKYKDLPLLGCAMAKGRLSWFPGRGVDCACAKGSTLGCVHRLWVVVTSSMPLKVYLFEGGVVIFGSVNKKRTDVDMPADDEVL